MVRLDGYNNIKGGWEKTILVLAFDIENRTMIFESWHYCLSSIQFK